MCQAEIRQLEESHQVHMDGLHSQVASLEREVLRLEASQSAREPSPAPAQPSAQTMRVEPPGGYGLGGGGPPPDFRHMERQQGEVSGVLYWPVCWSYSAGNGTRL